MEALRREGAASREEECAAFGRLCGGEPLELGRLANENPPKLRRDDEVEFHPAWHELLRIGVEHGLHAFPWEGRRRGAARRPRGEVHDARVRRGRSRLPALDDVRGRARAAARRRAREAELGFRAT